MKTISDENAFDTRQNLFVGVIAKSIKETLLEHGITEDDAHGLTGDLTFSVCALFDGCQNIEEEGVEIVPAITFKKSRESSEHYILGSGSWMHEYAFGFADAVFENDDEMEEDADGDADKETSSERYFYSIFITYSNGIQLEYSLPSLMGVDFDSTELAEVHYNIIDPTGEKIEILANKKPKEISPLFSSISAVQAINQVNEKIHELDVSGFDDLDLIEINQRISEQCKKL